jgi:AbrB family looped-hinge helix DNA binding protein
MEVLVSSKGQLVIPVELRRKYDMKPGTKVHVADTGDHIALKPITPAAIRKLRGTLKGGGALRFLEGDRDEERDL